MRKKRAYKKWIQLQTPKSKDEYLKAKREARDAARKARSKEWVKLGRFWATVKSRTKDRSEVGKLCDVNGQVKCDEEEARKRWRQNFATLLQSDGQTQ